MKCVKCGMEFNGSACPWCGESAADPQPRAKSGSALLLQVGCFILALLIGACGFVLAFADIFSYTVAGIAVESHAAFEFLTGTWDLSGNSVFGEYKAYVYSIGVLYLAPIVLRIKVVYEGVTGLGGYDAKRRSRLFSDALFGTVLSLLAMILYIVFGAAFFGDMPIAVGSLGVLPYVCFGVDLLLCLLALWLKMTKNEDEQAALTFWDAAGIRKPLTKKRVAVEITVNCLVAVAIILVYLFYPMFTDGADGCSLVQAYSSERIWKSKESFIGSGNEAAMTAGRGMLLGVFAAVALYVGACALLAFLYAKDPEKWYKRRQGIILADEIALGVLFLLTLFASLLYVDLEVYDLRVAVPVGVSIALIIGNTLFCNIFTVDLQKMDKKDMDRRLHRRLF